VLGSAATPSTSSEQLVSTRSSCSPCRSTISARSSSMVLAARDSPCRPAASAAAAKYRTSVTTPPHHRALAGGHPPLLRAVCASASSLPENRGGGAVGGVGHVPAAPYRTRMATRAAVLARERYRRARPHGSSIE